MYRTAGPKLSVDSVQLEREVLLSSSTNIREGRAECLLVLYNSIDITQFRKTHISTERDAINTSRQLYPKERDKIATILDAMLRDVEELESVLTPPPDEFPEENVAEHKAPQAQAPEPSAPPHKDVEP